MPSDLVVESIFIIFFVSPSRSFSLSCFFLIRRRAAAGAVAVDEAAERRDPRMRHTPLSHTPVCACPCIACRLPRSAPLFIILFQPSHPGKAGPFDPCRPVWPSYASRALGMALGAPWPRASPRRNRRSTICHRRLTCNLHVKGRGAEQRPDVDPRVFGEPRSAADA